jgi:hypothetical protein
LFFGFCHLLREEEGVGNVRAIIRSLERTKTVMVDGEMVTLDPKTDSNLVSVSTPVLWSENRVTMTKVAAHG